MVRIPVGASSCVLSVVGASSNADFVPKVHGLEIKSCGMEENVEELWTLFKRRGVTHTEHTAKGCTKGYSWTSSLEGSPRRGN